MTEILVVLFVALLVFGATKIPALGDALGRAVRGFRRAARGDDEGEGGGGGGGPPAAQGTGDDRPSRLPPARGE